MHGGRCSHNLSLPCKVCWPFCERPFCDGLWSLVLLSNAAFVWWCNEQCGNEFGGCVKFWLRAGGVEAIPFFEIAATSQHHLGNWKIFQLLQSQQSCCFCQPGSSNTSSGLLDGSRSRTPYRKIYLSPVCAGTPLSGALVFAEISSCRALFLCLCSVVSGN